MAIRVMFMGLGPIGCAVVKQVAGRKGFKIVGAIDVDPAKVGKDLGDVAGLGRKLRVNVTADARAALKASRPDVVAHCTVSSIKAALPQFQAILAARVPVVSSTEELSYPWRANRAAAKKIDEMAKKAKVAVLGTGVNPGFAMDALPIVLSGICQDVKRVEIDRVQDARIRRLPFQKKIGATLTPKEFDALVKTKAVRHVGLTESVSMLADALGFKIDRITDQIKPKIAAAAVTSDFLTVEPGQVCGIVQDGIGWRKGEAVISLHMEAYLGAPETYDEVRIEGSPNLKVRALGGYHGDIATASILVNSLPKVIDAKPGLHTMRTMPIPSFFRGAVV
ncbi:MAG: dihydrodipicolinate reductase [Vicinamibacteria bacterium]